MDRKGKTLSQRFTFEHYLGIRKYLLCKSEIFVVLEWQKFCKFNIPKRFIVTI